MTTDPLAPPPGLAVPPAPPARPRLWTLAAAIGAAVVGTGVGVMLTLGVFAVAFMRRIVQAGGAPPSAHALGAMIGSFATTAPGILAGGLVTALAFGGVAVLGGVLSPAGAAARLRLGASPRWLATGLAATPVLLGVGMVASQVAVALGLSERGTLPMLRRAFAGLSPPLFALALLIVGVGAGVGEELFFRGYLLTRLEQRARPWVANALVALAFALAHFDPVHSTFAFLIGLVQGWTARRSGSIRPAIVAHTLNNLLGVASMSIAGAAPEPFSPLELGGGVALAAAGVAGVWRLTRPR